ncbi:unnamed protein product [Ectocarpus sp. CCAP 1310/34]|nr:unnamed protein product [Ectocarpus sp. CCAP 1310/34]
MAPKPFTSTLAKTGYVAPLAFAKSWPTGASVSAATAAGTRTRTHAWNRQG